MSRRGWSIWLLTTAVACEDTEGRGLDEVGPSSGQAGAESTGGRGGDSLAGGGQAGAQAGTSGTGTGPSGQAGHVGVGGAGGEGGQPSPGPGGAGAQAGQAGESGQGGQAGQGGKAGEGGQGGHGGVSAGASGAGAETGLGGAGGAAGSAGQPGGQGGSSAGAGQGGSGARAGGAGAGGDGGAGQGGQSTVGVTQVVCTAESTCALRADGRVVCWGYGYSQPFGQSPSPIPVFRLLDWLDEVETLAGSVGDRVCARRKDGTVWCWGSSDFAPTGVTLPAQVAYFDDIRFPVDAMTGAVQLVVGGADVCARMPDQAVWCLGTAASYLYGQTQPMHFGGLHASELGEGVPACLLQADGSPVCWGNNTSGQLGNGETGGYTGISPVQTSVSLTHIASSSRHSCARVEDGTAVCWGQNWYGQLGNGESGGDAMAATPVAVQGLTDVQRLSVGSSTSCAVTTQGRVRCWGSNEGGWMGDPSLPHGLGDLKSWPVREVPNLIDVAQLTMGQSHTCVIKQNGTLWCWGVNGGGQVGQPPSPPGIVAEPTLVPMPMP